MDDPGSISIWIDKLKQGHSSAVRALWEQFFEKLVGVARRKLKGSPRRAADEEDVALTAFNSFQKGVREGRFPKLTGRDDLWRLLFRITERKAEDQRRWETRQKRGGKARGDSAMTGPACTDEPVADLAADPHPTPAFAAEVAENLKRLLDMLNDPELSTLALAKMEGYSNHEIADQQDCSVSKIERRLNRIRKKWQREINDE